MAPYGENQSSFCYWRCDGSIIVVAVDANKARVLEVKGLQWEELPGRKTSDSMTN